MPTYEYRCKDCGEHLEVVQAFADDPLTECPNCSGTLKKVFNSVGIAFKGSGFYKNDSRSSSTSTGRTGGSSTEGGSSSSKDTSSSSSSASTTSSSSGDGGSSSSSTKTETTPA
jgi:putative FmdB family regulatory protein